MAIVPPLSSLSCFSVNDRVNGRILALSCAALASSGTAARLELPKALHKLRSAMKTPVAAGQRQDFWLNPVILFSGRGKPTVQDNANAYARWGSRQSSFTEGAIWRTTNGKALFGVNSVFPPYEPCGDYPCGPSAAFVAFDAQVYRAPPENASFAAYSCSGTLPVPDPTDDAATRQALQAAQARLNGYRRLLRPGVKPQVPHVMCLFPQYGTTITVAVLNSDVAFADQDRALALYYIRFDKVLGTFTPSATP